MLVSVINEFITFEVAFRGQPLALTKALLGDFYSSVLLAPTPLAVQ